VGTANSSQTTDGNSSYFVRCKSSSQESLRIGEKVSKEEKASSSVSSSSVQAHAQRGTHRRSEIPENETEKSGKSAGSRETESGGT